VRSVAFLVLSVVGLAFSLSGAVGILRMPDLYTRIQCSSKTITMGALPALVALVVGEGVVTSYASRALIVAALLLIVNPAASHALARAAYKSGVPMWSGAVRDEVAERHESEQREQGSKNDGAEKRGAKKHQDGDGPRARGDRSEDGDRP
jgi:multicomponent Na+:H+ antiporter subunit G